MCITAGTERLENRSQLCPGLCRREPAPVSGCLLRSMASPKRPKHHPCLNFWLTSAMRPFSETELSATLQPHDDAPVHKLLADRGMR